MATQTLIDEIPGETLERIVSVLKGIAHPTRLQIVLLLCERDHTVGDMAERLGLRQSIVSQHLAPLRLLGLVAVDRTGGWGTYSLQEPHLRDLVRCLLSCRVR